VASFFFQLFEVEQRLWVLFEIKSLKGIPALQKPWPPP